MIDNHRSDPETAESDDKRHGTTRRNRGIRFSNPEWEAVKQAAQAHHMTPAEFVREKILDIARHRAGDDSDAIPRSLAPLIERTFRYTWMLATRMRDQMIDAGEREAFEKLIEDAGKLQDELLNEGSE